MTKAEKAAFAALEAERDLYRSWRLTEAVEPDIKPSKRLSQGWAPCTCVVSGASQMKGKNIGLYRGELNALRQSRHLLCMEAARQLADLDRRIAAAQAEEVSK